MNVAKSTLQKMIQVSLKHSLDAQIVQTDVPELSIARCDSSTDGLYTIYDPCLCFILQGEKVASVGKHLYKYGNSKYLVSTISLPVVGQVTKASKKSPYLCLILKLDSKTVYDVVSQMHRPKQSTKPSNNGLYIDDVTTHLQDTFSRLIDCLEDEEKTQIIAPMLVKEIIFSLLRSKQGHLIAQLGIDGSEINKISKAITKIQTHYNKTINAGELSKAAGMSLPAFYKSFKNITKLSPLQFQKKLRLTEARRLLITEGEDAATVSFKVGYESPSQFSREYSRMFGLPPIKDSAQIKKTIKI